MFHDEPLKNLPLCSHDCVGAVVLFHSHNKAGKNRYWVTNSLEMDYMGRKNLQAICWAIENFHRALKELCGVEKCKRRKEAGQRNHINCTLRAFICLEIVKKEQDIAIYKAKWEIIKVQSETTCKTQNMRYNFFSDSSA
jgi:hypothetical protein